MLVILMIIVYLIYLFQKSQGHRTESGVSNLSLNLLDSSKIIWKYSMFSTYLWNTPVENFPVDSSEWKNYEKFLMKVILEDRDDDELENLCFRMCGLRYFLEKI